MGALNNTAVPFICKYRYQTEETTYHVWLCLYSKSLRLAKNSFFKNSLQAGYEFGSEVVSVVNSKAILYLAAEF